MMGLMFWCCVVLRSEAFLFSSLGHKFILNNIIEQGFGTSNKWRFVDLSLNVSVGSVCHSCSCEGVEEESHGV